MSQNKASATKPHDIPRLLRMIGLSYKSIGDKIGKTPTTVSAYFNNKPFCGQATGKKIREIVNAHIGNAENELKKLKEI